jgi:hypothetical protein
MQQFLVFSDHHRHGHFGSCICRGIVCGSLRPVSGTGAFVRGGDLFVQLGQQLLTLCLQQRAEFKTMYLGHGWRLSAGTGGDDDFLDVSAAVTFGIDCVRADDAKVFAGEFENIWRWLIVSPPIALWMGTGIQWRLDLCSCKGYDKQFATYVRLRTEPMEFEAENSFCAQQPPKTGDDAPIAGPKRFKDRLGRLPDTPRK